MNKKTYRWGLIESLPKSDIHCHLDGSLRLDTIFDLAKEQNVKTILNKSKKELKDILIMEGKGVDLLKYLEAFDYTVSVMQTPTALERIAFELAEDSAKENVRYLEVRYAPQLHTDNMTMEENIASVVKGLIKAEKQYNILTGVIICCLRNLTLATSKYSRDLQARVPFLKNKSLSQVIAYNVAQLTTRVAKTEPKIIGIDLAGAEKDYPAEDFKYAFKEAMKHRVSATVHAGEAYNWQSIDQALKHCHAQRIGHGTNLQNNPVLLNYVVNRRIPLEICVTSNLQTCNSIKSVRDHPLSTYLNKRVRTAICTDNRLMSDTTITKELYLVAEAFDLSDDVVKLLIMHGFNSAFMNSHSNYKNTYDQLRELRTQIEEELKINKVKSRLKKKNR